MFASLRATFSRTAPALAAAALLCLPAMGAGWGALAPMASAAGIGSSATGNPAIDKQVQEALAKAQSQGGAASAPSGGVGGGGSFSKLTEKGSEEEEPSTPKTVNTARSGTSGSLSAGVLIPILIVGGGLLVGVAFLILRDARGVTPMSGVLAAAGNAEARAARLRKRRARAKAAKRQRRRNR